MNLTHSTRATPQFPERTRLAVVRDVAVIAVSLALIVGFLAHVWRAPPPPPLHSQAAQAAEVRA
ncbi:MAG TPA: hypothetical protein VFP65_22660 [Anaeromyxobacteraceae bacterium]|nr:hypothetical protein [Anaeromyxobacteraceae bacterium]